MGLTEKCGVNHVDHVVKKPTVWAKINLLCSDGLFLLFFLLMKITNRTAF